MATTEIRKIYEQRYGLLVVIRMAAVPRPPDPSRASTEQLRVRRI